MLRVAGTQRAMLVLQGKGNRNKEKYGLTKEEVIEHCRECMTGYKVPKFIEFRDDLPKSNVGKILRRLLKE